MRQFCYEVFRMRARNRCVRSGDTALFWREMGVIVGEESRGRLGGVKGQETEVGM